MKDALINTSASTISRGSPRSERAFSCTTAISTSRQGALGRNTPRVNYGAAGSR